MIRFFGNGKVLSTKIKQLSLSDVRDKATSISKVITLVL